MEYFCNTFRKTEINAIFNYFLILWKFYVAVAMKPHEQQL